MKAHLPNGGTLELPDLPSVDPAAIELCPPDQGWQEVEGYPALLAIFDQDTSSLAVFDRVVGCWAVFGPIAERRADLMVSDLLGMLRQRLQ